MSRVVHGRVTGAGAPLAGVAVSDGYRVVQTDLDGTFRLPVDDRSGRFAFISCPKGWWTDAFYAPLADELRFELIAREEDDERHFGLYLTDMHLEGSDRGQAARFRACLERINALDPPPAFVLFGGDICLQGGVGDAYRQVLALLRPPVRNTVGNHELMVGEANPFAAYEALFGPPYYSFNVGRVHYVALCGMVPDLGYNDYRNVHGRVTEDELHWLRQDLAAKPKGAPVVVFSHIPLVTTYAERRGTTAKAVPWWVMTNADEVIDLLAAHDTRLVLQGHLHENERTVRDGIEFVSSASIAGRWWSRQWPPDIGVDGAPRGYRRVEADGTKIAHRFVPDPPNDEIACITAPAGVVSEGKSTEVWVNVFDGGADTRVTVSVDDAPAVAAEPAPWPGGLWGERFDWPHHYRANVSGGWVLGRRRTIRATIESPDGVATIEQTVAVTTEKLMRKKLVVNKGTNLWNGIPGIERSPNGTLWVCCFTGGDKEPHEENRILTLTSSDDGETWSAPVVREDPAGGTRAFDPCLFLAPGGRLWLYYNRACLDPLVHELWAAINERPDDPTSPFGARHVIDLGVPYAFRINKPTITSWGEWYLPVTYSERPVPGWFGSAEHRQGVAISSDEGATWTLHGAVEAPPWALENMIVERLDGSLWMLMRTGAGRLWESHSTDRGRTWSPGGPTEIVNPGSRFFIRRLASGRLLLINSPRPDARTSLTAQLSDDDGRTWSPPLVLDERPAVSYPDACFAPDGRIYAVYDRDRGGAGEVLLAVFTEDDVPRE